MNDDVFDFFYEALPGYEEVGRRRILLGCWGAFQNAQVCDYRYETMNDWGKAMYVTPGVVVDGELLTNNLVDINLGHPHPAGQLLLRRLGQRGARSSPTTRWATRSTSATPGTRRRCPSRASGTSTTATAG